MWGVCLGFGLYLIQYNALNNFNFEEAIAQNDEAIEVSSMGVPSQMKDKSPYDLLDSSLEMLNANAKFNSELVTFVSKQYTSIRTVFLSLLVVNIIFTIGAVKTNKIIKS